MSPIPGTNRLANIQILRAIAAVMVMISHVGTDMTAIAARRGESFAFAPAPWGSGVDLFFVVSGFIMVITAADGFGRPGAPRDFIRKRLVRIVPLYWLLTSLALMGGLVAPGLLSVPIVDIGHVVASYLFWPFPRANGEIRPVLALGWTLNFEILFYALFAAALAFPRRIGLVVLAGALVGLSLWGTFGHPPGTALAFWAQPILLEFLGGMGIGLAWRAGWRLGAAPAALMATAGFALLALSGTAPEPREAISAIAWLCPAAMLVTAGAALGPQAGEGLIARVLGAVGDASYSLYLVHPFAIRPLRNLWIAGDLPLALYPLATMAVALAAALALYRLFERPTTQALTRWFIRARVSKTPQPAE